MCWNCWCWCEETPISNWCNCSIIGKNNTSITQEWNDIVVSSPFYEVVSSDSTVVVTKTTVADPNVVTFDLSKPCCPDRLVAVATECTNWVTLKEWIQVDTSWPLTWTQNWCNSMNLWFDVSKLTAKDEKVKWKSSCPAVFWDQLLTAWTGIKIEDVWCKWRVSVTDKQWIRPIRRWTLETNLTVEYEHAPQALTPNNWWFCIETQWNWFIDWGTNDFAVTWQPFIWENLWQPSDWSWEMLWWVCPKRWYYDVWMTASFWVNWGISAARVTLTSDIPWKEVLLNVWFSNSNDRALAMDQFADNDSDEDLIVYNWQWTRDLVLIEEWQVIYWLFWRMATEISGNWQTTTAPFPNGVMTIFSTPFWFNPWGMGNAVGNPWQWTFWWVAWHCDENWDARYFKE